MEEMARRVLEMIDRAVDTIGGWVRGGAEDVRFLEPATWSPGFWALVGALAVLVALAAFRRRSREPMTVRPPEILVTRGELVPDAGAGRGGGGTLTMTVSNLSRYPVQVLEVAVRTGGAREFGVTEVSALVPAMGEVDVETRLPVGRLDDGVLDVFAYAAATRVKTYRHRAELVWEPWAKRFKVAPLEQRIVPARTLPSTRSDAVRLAEDLVPPEGVWAASPYVPRAERPAGGRSGVPEREPRAQAVGAARRPHDDLRDDRREAEFGDDSDARDAGGSAATGPATLFALLESRSDDARHGRRTHAGGASGPKEQPVRATSGSSPAPTPASTPSESVALHDLLVTDVEIAPPRAPRPHVARGAGATDRRPAAGSPNGPAERPEGAGRATPAAPVNAAPVDAAPVNAAPKDRPPEGERRRVVQVETVDRGDSVGSSAGRPRDPADEGLAPRRERSLTPLEFPDEF